MGDFRPQVDRARLGWWLFVLALAAAAAFIAYSFVGLIALGVFGYYATRPVYQRLKAVIDRDGLAAWLTLLLVLGPILIMLGYAGVRTFQQAQAWFGSPEQVPLLGAQLQSMAGYERETLLAAVENPSEILQNPRETVPRILRAGRQVFSAVFGTLLLLSLSVTLSFFLLKNDDALSDGLRDLFGGADSTAYAYAAAVDKDLESVFFGNFLFVLSMSVVATAAYWGTNVLSPSGLRVPMVFVLGFLTGVASLIPIVVGKVIYLPVVAYLGLQAVQGGGDHLPFVGGALAVYVLVLDLLPQTFLQPYITGRQLDVLVLMFAYLLGPILFGWYGFFFLPILFVLMLEAVRIVLPELVHGEPVRPDLEMGESVGSDPDAASDEAYDGEGDGSEDES
ncbi:AI-2E family transporter [Halostella sp. JP-L12]|uniref:AI-2E family transporter n=1 Tax=Halostella TaxID=1843185 RepID=UPI000EF7D700|nr:MULTISPECIES: AI-2E family transporter [Halostella]NHN49735.1 AI-2E family transporter [Halostella sp. JP-L12]